MTWRSVVIGATTSVLLTTLGCSAPTTSPSPTGAAVTVTGLAPAVGTTLQAGSEVGVVMTVTSQVPYEARIGLVVRDQFNRDIAESSTTSLPAGAIVTVDLRFRVPADASMVRVLVVVAEASAPSRPVEAVQINYVAK
jgi:hypothetical protein